MNIAAAIALVIWSVGFLIIATGAYANYQDWKMSRLDELDD